jgi:hypothetical protein
MLADRLTTSEREQLLAQTLGIAAQGLAGQIPLETAIELDQLSTRGGQGLREAAPEEFKKKKFRNEE